MLTVKGLTDQGSFRCPKLEVLGLSHTTAAALSGSPLRVWVFLVAELEGYKEKFS